MNSFLSLFEGDGSFSVKTKSSGGKKKKRLFKLSAMNELVKQNKFLKSKYDKLSVDAEEKLGYHWNEVVQNIIFNKFVKNIKQLMNRYLAIKRELEHTEKGENGDASETVNNHPTQQMNNKQPTEPTTMQNAVKDQNQDGPLDTRIVQEMDSATAGNYSYETPAFGFAGSMNQFLGAWSKRNKATNANLDIVKPKNNNKNKMGINEATDLLNLDALNELFTDYFGVEPLAEEKKHDALVRLDKLKAENKKNELGYLKSIKDTAQKPVESKIENAGADWQKQLDSTEGDKIPHKDLAMHHPSKDEEEYIELHRGQGLVDRLVLGLDDEMSPELKKRVTDQAGKETVDKAIAKRTAQNKSPKHADTVNVRTVNENVQINALYEGSYRRRHSLVFVSDEAKELNEATENLTLLETTGLGNAENEISEVLIESYNFFVDLSTNEIFKVKKNNSLNESATSKATLDKNTRSRFNALLKYSGRK